MSEVEQGQTNPAPNASEVDRIRFYAPWMIGVLVVFGICEIFLFIWGYKAAEYAMAGLLGAMFFAVWRVVHVAIRRGYWVEMIAAIVIFLVLVVLLVPAIKLPRRGGYHWACANHLKQLGVAILTYEFENEQFPPAFVADEMGRPMHSWRTLILPFIERKDLYDRCDFKQPWDAPENLAVVTEAEFSCLLQCPSMPDSGRAKHRTDYVAVTGDDTIWPADGTWRSLKDIKVDPSSVAMLTEITNSDIAWYEPRDVKLEDLLSGKVSWRDTSIHCRRSAFYDPVPYHNVVFADGNFHMIPSDLSPDQIRRIFSIAEPIDVEKEVIEPARHPIVYRHVIFYIWLATLVLQFVYIFFPVEKRVGGADPE